MYMKRPRTHQQRALRKYVARAEKKNRYNRHARGDRENERAFLERADWIVVPSRALRKHDYRVPRSNSFGRDVVCGERSFTCLSVDWNHPNGAYGRAENGNFEELCFCDEFVSRKQDRKSTRLNSSHSQISYAVFCLKKKKKNRRKINIRRAQH